MPRRLKPSGSSHNKGKTGTYSSQGHLPRQSREGNPVIYAAPVERRGTGWALFGGSAAWAGWRGEFRDAGICWTWLGLDLGSAESAVAEGRASGPAAVPGLPAAGSCFPCASGLSWYLSQTLPAWQGKKKKRLFALSPCPVVCRKRLSLTANTLWRKDEFWAVPWGWAKKGCAH